MVAIKITHAITHASALADAAHSTARLRPYEPPEPGLWHNNLMPNIFLMHYRQGRGLFP